MIEKRDNFLFLRSVFFKKIRLKEEATKGHKGFLCISIVLLEVVGDVKDSGERCFSARLNVLLGSRLLRKGCGGVTNVWDTHDVLLNVSLKAKEEEDFQVWDDFPLKVNV